MHPLLRNASFRFVLLLGVVSLFADFAYEGARSITGPYLAALGASGALVSIVAGFGELTGYGLRIVSGRLSERTGRFWPITIVGYGVQMTAVPLLALAGSWQVAALLIVAERMGKAIRNPPRDVMLSHAAKDIGLGLGFGIHEAMDQLGALIGPLAVAAVLAHHGDYRLAFAVLALPALLTLALVFLAPRFYPQPKELKKQALNMDARALPRSFWIYLAGAALVAASFPDFSLMAFHFHKLATVSTTLIPVFYAVTMGVGGLGSLVFGRLFDRYGIRILIPLTMFTILSVPLAFLGHFWGALAGCVLWGLGMGVHESIIPAAVATMVPLKRRASAYGLFTAGYGLFWFLGSVAIGLLYEVSLPGVIGFSVTCTIAAVICFLALGRVKH